MLQSSGDDEGDTFVKETGSIAIEWDPNIRQVVPLSAKIFRPVLAVAPCYYNYGVIRTENNSTASFAISNLSRATASWSVRSSDDNDSQDQAVNDPSVFQFSQSTGCVSHGPTRLPTDHLGQSKLPHDIISQETSKLVIGRQEPTTIQVTFQPKTAARYQTTFYFDVEFGESFSVCLVGRGTFQEI